MKIALLNSFKKFDWILVLVVFLLILFGLVTIYSIGQNSDPATTASFTKQLVSVGIGFALMIIFSLISFHFWKNYSVILYIVGFLLLLGVLIFGTEIGGTKGWISLFGLTFQPVEFVKLFLLFFLAYFFSKNQLNLYNFKNIIISGASVGLYLILVLLQPDMGSAIIMAFVWLGIVFFTKTKKSHLLIVTSLIVILIVCSWFFVLQDYQKSRLTTFVNPGADPLGEGYNITQSIIAVGSGEMFGRGLGLGPQSQLNFLPTQETDFIFSVIAEELGFVGAGLIVVIFALLFWRLFRILRRSSHEAFSSVFIIGAIIILFSQFFINIGMNIGIMPITGLPLPFVSLAGTSIIVNLAIIGIIQSIIIHSNKH